MSLQIWKTLSHLHESRITCLSYNAKGKELYTGGEDCQIRVWDIVTEERKKTFYGHKCQRPPRPIVCRGHITALCFIPQLSRDGVGVLVSASIDGQIIVWNPNGAVLQVQWHSSTGPIQCLCFNPHKSTLIAGGQGVIFIYSVVNHIERQFLVEDGSDNAQYLVKGHKRGGTGSDKGVMLSHKYRVKVLSRLNEVGFRSDFVKAVTYDASGRTYATGYERDVLYWDDDAGDFTTSFKDAVNGTQAHAAAITSIDIDESSSAVITASLDGCVKTWSYEGRLMDTFFGVAERINSMVFIPSIRSAWCSGLNGTITSLDISSGSNNTEYLDRLCGLSTVKMVSLWHFREDSSVFAITADREVVVWRLNLFRPTRCFPSPANKVECLAVVDTRLRGRGMEVVVTGTTEGFLHFWHEDVERAGGVLQVTHDLKPHESAVLCITFVHDIGCFATGGDDGNVVLYTMQDGTEDLLADSPKGGHTSSSAGTVAKLKGHTARVTGLLYLGGRRLASCSHDATIKIWDLDKVSLHHSIDDAHETPISMLCEAAERNEFASVAFELSVRVWCAKTYAPKYKLSGGHTAEIVCCSWRPLRPRSRDTKIVFRQNHRSYLAERKATGQTEAGALNVRGQLKREMQRMQQRMDGGVSKVVTKVIKGMRISKEKREEEDRHMAALRNLGKETDSGGGEASRQSQDGGFGVDESGIRGSDPSGSPSTSGGRGTDHSEPSARAGREASKDSKWKMVRGASVRGLGSGVSGQAEGLGLWIMDGGGKRRSRWERMQQRIGAGAGKAETVPQKQPSWITELAKVGEEVDAELAQKPHPMKGKLELKLEDSDSDKSYITSDDEGQGPEAAEEQEALAAQGWGEWVTAGEDEVLCVWDFKESDEAPSVRMSISFGGQSITSMFVDWRKLPSGEMEALLVAAMVDKQFRVFKADTLQLLARYEGHADKISGVSKLRDSGNYISAGYDGGLFLWLSTAQLHNRKGIIAKTAQFPAGLFGSRDDEDREDGVFVSEFERKYPLRKPKALMEDNTRMRKEPMSRALAQRRVEEPSWEEEFRNVTLAAKLDAVEAHLRKMERDSAQKSDKADRAAEAAPTLPVQKSAMAPVPKGGALQKWQENRRRRDENIAKDIAAIRNNMKP